MKKHALTALLTAFVLVFSLALAPAAYAYEDEEINLNPIVYNGVQESPDIIGYRPCGDGFDIGDEIIFGQYKQSNYDVKEDVEWIILDRTADDQVLVLSKYCLLELPCVLHPGNNTSWSQSDVRYYLNSYFYDDAFSDEEKTAITGGFSPSTGSYSFITDVDDDVFILSAEELRRYLPVKETRIAMGGPAAGAFCQDSLGYGNCWLRDADETPGKAPYIDKGGTINSEGIDVDYWCLVRPAMWLDVKVLKGFNSESADTSASDDTSKREVFTLACTDDHHVKLYSLYETLDSGDWHYLEDDKIHLSYVGDEQIIDCRALIGRDLSTIERFDFDNDGQDELVYNSSVMTGTGVNGDELLVLEWENGEFICNRFSLEDMEKAVQEHVTVEYDGEKSIVTITEGKNKKIAEWNSADPVYTSGAQNYITYDFYYDADDNPIYNTDSLRLVSQVVLKEDGNGGYDCINLSLARCNGDYDRFAGEDPRYIITGLYIEADLIYTGNSFEIKNFDFEESEN